MSEMHKYAKKVKKQNASQLMDFPRVAFLCTLIKKEVIDKIGGLDERFSPGNFEDDDFCLRAQKAGYKAVIAKDVFIHHYGSKSFKAGGEQKYAERLEINKQKFVDKWGATIEEIWLQGKKTKDRNIVCPLDNDLFFEYYLKAFNSFKDNEFAFAEEYLKNALDLYEKAGRDDKQDEYVKLLNLYGNLYLMNDDLVNAQEYFERALETSPDSAGACAGLGYTFLAAELFSEAKPMLEWAVKYAPNSDYAAKGLASANARLGLPEDNNSLLIQENENKMDNRIEQAEALIEANDLAGAADILGNVLNEEPSNLDALNDIAVVSIMAGDYDAAADFIEKALKQDPQNEVALGNLDFLNEIVDKKMQEIEAEKNNQSADNISVPPVSAIPAAQSPYQPVLLKAEEFITQEDFVQARKMIETVLLMDNNNIDALNDLAIVEIHEYNFGKAAGLIKQVLASEPENDVALGNMNVLNSMMKKL
jgi:tetratricopeptide (TPR) repeat protein